MFTEYADLFKDELGKLPVTYSMKLDPEVLPAVKPARKIPVPMQDKVKAELTRMVDLGVITPVADPTEWVSSMVATHKKNSDDIRLCIDTRDLNKALKRPHHPMRTVEEVAAQMANSTVFSVLDAKNPALQKLSGVISKGWPLKQTQLPPEIRQYFPYRDELAVEDGANGLAERAVRSAKQLMERSKRDGTDIFLNLLNLRNVPRDHPLGSPAERLMSRQTRTTLPVSKRLLVPKSKDNTVVTAELIRKRLSQKQCYDKSSRPLRPLHHGEIVRMQTPHGHDRLGTIKAICKEPRSYIVQSEGGEYRRNRRHILPVPEPPPQQRDPHDSTPAVQSPTSHPDQRTYTPVQNTDEKTLNHTQTMNQDPVQSSHGTANDIYITRSGRAFKPNPKYVQ
ncbi:hypothetical protein N1851_015902 [Merluccius polli]|uniref:Uncharacterized protein n=1 Tax=Merluccius polli TaxID=89951 RepID=A0AA47MRE3_MERPO|nr:hypothetical protein N1851_015902 [Merluccius polli]